MKNLLISIFLMLSIILLRLVDWLQTFFGDVTMEKIIFHLNVPIEGADNRIALKAIFYVIVPSVAIAIFIFLILIINEKIKDLYKNYGSLSLNKIVKPIPYLKKIIVSFIIIILGLTIYSFDKNFGALEYVKAQNINSLFIEENYIYPDSQMLTFPEEKRNLIYIYLESIENTFADTSSGGAYKDNYIPELTELAKKNISFSNTEKLGGYQEIAGTGWTMASMFSQSTGLPLKLPIQGNEMSSYSEFFPGVVSIGDILESNGYKNYLMIGSDSKFGGRKNFYQQHGNYEIFDYYTAIDRGLIESDYHVWWDLKTVNCLNSQKMS